MDENSPVRDYKTRNILSLEERVEVIRAFKRNPVYQRLAEQFHCSGKQIKNIIANKDAILLYYSKCYMEAKDGCATDARYIKRHQKIVFLGDVIYEFVQRALYHGVPINANSVCQKALEVKESIAIDNFYPNNAWVRNFKVTHNIPDFEIETLKAVVPLTVPKKSSFNAIDLVNYVSQREKNANKQQEQHKQLQQQEKTHDENGNSEFRIVLQENGNLNEPTVAYENDDDMETDENSVEILVTLDSDEEEEKPKIKLESAATPDMQLETPTLQPLPDIASYQEALRHLKALEDFAMLEDNFRAIGLITQLEQVFKNPPKRDDFET